LNRGIDVLNWALDVGRWTFDFAQYLTQMSKRFGSLGFRGLTQEKSPSEIFDLG